MRWGAGALLVGKPLKELRMATFNARAEAVEIKSNAPAAYFRCQAITSGRHTGGETAMVLHGRRSSPLLTAAGLWDEWKNRERASS